MPFPHDATFAWKCVCATAGFLRPLACNLTVEGIDHVPRRGGCVVACNHTPGHDYIPLGYVTPRQVYFMAKAEAFTYHPLLTQLLASISVFPVRRGHGDQTAVAAAVELVKSGRVVGMFPEGTRSKDSKLKQGKTGAVRIAAAAGAPIVPAVVIGSAAMMSQFGQIWRRPDVTVRYGPPMAIVGDPSDRDVMQRETDRLMRTMAAMLPPEMRGVWADEVAGEPEG